MKSLTLSPREAISLVSHGGLRTRKLQVSLSKAFYTQTHIQAEPGRLCMLSGRFCDVSFRRGLTLHILCAHTH